ncbi:nucleotidyltransferase family protein [Paenibacillus turpanensis]|uniref:nucleotidyltransferase family protein n=1 Tax=Paenibacillus turpanensis TaxID=2689078 RepID=UPI00140A5C75|nr:nucleotidyltransferase family protein [Paenibacillus turpanensis]
MKGSEGPVVAIYLAAGSSSRMGEPKLSLPAGEAALGTLALQAVLDSEVDHTIVVIQEDRETGWIGRFLGERLDGTWSLVVCREAESGMAYSIRCGIKEAVAKGARAAVFVLADQPFITRLMINRLLRAERDNPGAGFVASGDDGTPKPPVWFSRRLFPELLRLEGDEGARKLLRQPEQFGGVRVDFAERRCFMDIDTPEDYANARRYFGME